MLATVIAALTIALSSGTGILGLAIDRLGHVSDQRAAGA